MEEIRKTIFDKYEVSNLGRFRKIYVKSRKIVCWIEEKRYYCLSNWKSIRHRIKKKIYMDISCIRYNYIKWSTVKINKDWKSYISIMIYRKRYSIHRLVASAFLWLDLNDSNIYVCHIDDNPENNCVSNLMLGNAKSNIVDASMKNRMKWKLSLEDVKQIRKLFDLWLSNRWIWRRFWVSNVSIWRLRHNKHRWKLVI